MSVHGIEQPPISWNWLDILAWGAEHGKAEVEFRSWFPSYPFDAGEAEYKSWYGPIANRSDTGETK